MNRKSGCRRPHRGDRLRPERRVRRRQAVARQPAVAPGARDHVGQQQHRHVAADAVAAFGDRAAARPVMRLAQAGVAVVELERVRPAGEVGIAAVGQDRAGPVPRRRHARRSSAARGPGRPRCRRCSTPGARSTQGWSRRRVVGHEVEQQLEAAPRQPLAQAARARRRRRSRRGPGRPDGERRAGDVLVAQVGQLAKALVAQRRVACATPRVRRRRSARRPGTRPSRSRAPRRRRGGRRGRRPASPAGRAQRPARCEQTRVLIWYSSGCFTRALRVLRRRVASPAAPSPPREIISGVMLANSCMSDGMFAVQPV